jgi:TRAP-type C4-dicarboxylate transport system substrate-binding protein
VVISSDLWDELTEDQRELLREAALESTEYQKEVWAEAVEEAIEEAEEMGVEFHYPDQEPFYEAVQSLHEQYREDEKIAEMMDAFEQLRE